MSVLRSWFDQGIASFTVGMPRVYTTRMPKRRPPAGSKYDTERRADLDPEEPGRSRWRTPEFILYAVVLGWAMYRMFLQGMALSQESHRNYPHYKHKLEPGWLPGRRIDNSDSQYRTFRQGFPSLIALAAGYLAVSKLFSRLYGPRSRMPFLVASSAVITTALHGMSILKILAILSLSYTLGRLGAGRRWGVPLTWIFNVALIFANDYYDGYRFRHIHPILSPLDAGNLRGLLPRWQIGFNIAMLRLLSFSLDYHQAVTSAASAIKDDADISRPLTSAEDGHSPDEKMRVKRARPLSEYTLPAYFAYVLYPPLYIAGPIITFNNFMSQVKQPPRIPRTVLIGYAIRFGLVYLVMEWTIQNIYAVAIKDAHAWAGDTPFELAMVGYWSLIHTWLKLLIPWRFFRFWSLADNIDPPENMIRCMANNYSTFGFWRSWHRSYNLWIVRYIYVPLGGSGNPFVSTLLVFTFVALWHDLSFRLLMWGWGVSIFVMPELIAGYVLPFSKYGDRWWYRHACALGGSFNVLTMMSANLVGFAIGMDGIQLMWTEMLGSLKGIALLLTAVFVFFSASHLMMEYRAEEMRRVGLLPPRAMRREDQRSASS